jgi:DNA-binding winged helix-turn-helix (wHTH) protein/tetratricopeptide (TPR) repeat protein
MEQPAAPDSSTRFGIFELDAHSGELRKAGTRIRLQDQPLKILMVLLEQPGAVVTREDLKRRIWPHDSFGDFDHAVNVAVAKLRAALADSADLPRYVETLPRRGYRFIFPVTSPAEAPRANGTVPTAPTQAPAEKTAQFTWTPILAATLIVVVLSASAWWWLSSRKTPPMLTDKDTVVLADFENTTGDPVFDGTLRQGLTVELEQSPFLSLVSELTVKQTLRLMSQPPDARLTPDIARQLCLRTGSAAVLDGSIARLGNQYVLGLKAVNCRSGDSLVEEQVTAGGKEEVLKSLAQAASRLRTKLGESLGTVQKYNAPLEQVTTPSLQALHAYSLGRTTLIDMGDHAAGIQLLQRAIKLDPNFAMAYASLGLAYAESSEKESVWNYRKAYELRDRVSDRERFYIEAHYYQSGIGDWEKARQVYELWSQLYPRDDIAHLNLGLIYSNLGQYEDARKESAESLRLLPGDCLSYGHLLGALLHLNRWDEARALLKDAEEQKADCFHLQEYRYALAFLQNDKAAMAQIVNTSNDKWKVEFLHIQAQTAAYYGRLGESRELMRRILLTARRSEQEDLNGLLEGFVAESEALFGNHEWARKDASEALVLSKGQDVEGIGAVALALAGDEGRAQILADDLAKRFPESTLVQRNYLPSIRAQLALNRMDPARALDNLQMAAPYELGNSDGSNALFPVFLRGQAYLLARQGRDAAAEFQKILDHPGTVLSESIGPLAHLGLARAYALEGDMSKARSGYQEFFTLWKDADPDLPILKQAKVEYAKLQ